MLNVLHAYKVYAPEVVGGIPEVIRQLAMGLSASCRAEILVSRTSGFGSVETGEGAPIRRTPSLGSLASMPIAPSYPFHLWGGARRADLVAYHAPFPLVDLTVSTHFPRDTALVVHWHSEIVAQRRLLPLVAPLIRRTLRRADRIIVSSPAMIERSPFLGPFAEKCAVIPYGIDLDQWTALTASQQVHIEQLRARHPRLVVAAGRLVRYKGYDVLIEAMRHVDGELMIVGVGPLEAALRRQVAGAGLSGRVHFAGFLPFSDLKCLMHAARLFVLPSIGDNEAFGIVQLEAMACGKAIVNTRLATGVPWVARDGAEARTVSPGSTAELTAAIRQLLDDGDGAAELGRRGRARVAELFERACFLAKTLAAYEAAALRRRSHSGGPLAVDKTALDQRIGP